MSSSLEKKGKKEMLSSDEKGREEVEAHLLSSVPSSFLNLQFVLGVLEFCLENEGIVRSVLKS